MLITGSLFFLYDDFERSSRCPIKFNSAVQLFHQAHYQPVPASILGIFIFGLIAGI
jgi:hypothetical protein